MRLGILNRKQTANAPRKNTTVVVDEKAAQRALVMIKKALIREGKISQMSSDISPNLMGNIRHIVQMKANATARLLKKLSTVEVTGDCDKAQMQAWAKSIENDVTDIDLHNFQADNITECLGGVGGITNSFRYIVKTKADTSLGSSRAVYWERSYLAMVEKTGFWAPLLSQMTQNFCKVVLEDNKMYLKIDKGYFDGYLKAYCHRVGKLINDTVYRPLQKLSIALTENDDLNIALRQYSLYMSKETI